MSDLQIKCGAGQCGTADTLSQLVNFDVLSLTRVEGGAGPISAVKCLQGLSFSSAQEKK